MLVDPSIEGSKVCPKCKERKLLYDFYAAFTKGRIHSWCKECESIHAYAYYTNNWERKRIKDAKTRARYLKIPFNLTEEYIKSIAPTDMVCPALGIQMKVGENFKDSKVSAPSLDRLIPKLGYVKGNIVIVSTRANTLKRDATPEELMKIAKFYKKVFKEQNPRQLVLDL